MKEWQGKVAVVTGAGSGIGRAMALDFARRGMRLVMADIESGTLERVGLEVAALGGEGLTHVTDVSDAEAVHRLADAAYGRFGAVNVLCNNAGVTAGGVPIVETELNDWRWVLGVNLWGAVHGINAFLPRMLKGGEPGHVVNTGSILGVSVPWPNTAPYVTSKFAVVGLSEALALELEDSPISVTVVCPGSVDTHIYEAERNRPPHLKAARTPIDLRGRMTSVSVDWVTPEEVSSRVMRAIEGDRLYVFTHADAPGLIEARYRRMIADAE